MKYIIVGGVAGGASAAARLRRMDEKADILLIERGRYVSYANCGLPYYIGGVINDREKLFVQTVKGFVARFRIDIRTEHEVLSIDKEKKTVEIRSLNNDECYTETYDKLILSPGAEPVRPPIEGINSVGIFTLRNVPDTDAIKHYIHEQKPSQATVIGGGFIGLEMAENLCEQGIQVTVVEMADQVMAPLDFSMASIVHQHLIQKGIQLILNDGVKCFKKNTDGITISLDSGKEIESHLVILSIGVRPENKLAKDAGLATGERGGIIVNDFLQTSDEDIYAIGDAIEVKNLITGQGAMIPLAGPANKQGRIVADNACMGNKRSYKGSIGTSIAKIFDLTVAAAGANAKLLQRAKIPHVASFTHGSSHAGYYPGAVAMSIKIIFSPENGRLLGAQVIGFEGVDKRIEMLAQIIRQGGTVYDLTEMEHAYAPPFSSAKDPVNMAGFVAENILTNRVQIIHWRALSTLTEKTQKIDVRTADEFALGTIPGFVNIPIDDLREHLEELDKQRPIVVTCAVGLRGYLACRILLQHGFKDVRNLSGGYKTWKEATSPIYIPKAFIEKTNKNSQGCPITNVRTIDACGLMCPGPILQLKKGYTELAEGEILRIQATDQAFARDVESWCRMTGAKLVNIEQEDGIIRATIGKLDMASQSSGKIISNSPANDRKTIIVFSDDLDKALASFVIANGAAATNKKVTMFFTFWGLNVIKKQRKPKTEKDIFGKMFGWMLPSHSGELKLSKMNMGGIGNKMMRFLMKKKRIDSLESLMQQAIDNNIEMIACTMSMDVMGIKQEELMEHVKLGGVATYLERAEEANLNLFI